MGLRPAYIRRRGYSLLEVVMASAICATALVPALALVREGLELADKIDTRHQILLCGVSKMEELLPSIAALGDNWPGTSPPPGSFVDYPSIRYIVTWSDAPASGGITGRLMNVAVTTYSDDNGNSALDASEARTILTTKVSNLATYVEKAGT